MAELVNLKRVRKAKEQIKKRSEASENAVKFGQSKQQKAAESTAADKATRFLDGHKRIKDD